MSSSSVGFIDGLDGANGLVGGTVVYLWVQRGAGLFVMLGGVFIGARPHSLGRGDRVRVIVEYVALTGRGGAWRRGAGLLAGRC